MCHAHVAKQHGHAALDVTCSKPGGLQEDVNSAPNQADTRMPKLLRDVGMARNIVSCHQ
jgi:hypothetical protein